MPPPTIIMSVSTTSAGGLSHSAFAMPIGGHKTSGVSAMSWLWGAEGPQESGGGGSEVHSTRSGAARPAMRAALLALKPLPDAVSWDAACEAHAVSVPAHAPVAALQAKAAGRSRGSPLVGSNRSQHTLSLALAAAYVV